jgi:hypothetical protein
MTWLFHNQGENNSESLRLGFVLSPLFTFLNQKCVLLKSPRRLHLISSGRYRTKRPCPRNFQWAIRGHPILFLLIICSYLQSVITCLNSWVLWLGYGLNDPGFESRLGATDFSVLIVHIVYGARPASYTVGAGMLPVGHSGRSVMLTTQLQTQRLIMGGFVSRLSQYVGSAWKGTTWQIWRAGAPREAGYWG